MVASEEGLEEAGESAWLEEQARLLDQGFSFSGYERNRLYRHRGGGTPPLYRELSGVSGIDHQGDGRAVVFADFDNDGDHDLFATTLQGPTHLLYRNNIGQSAGWLRLELTGSHGGGAGALGAVVRVRGSAGTQTRIRSAGSGFLSQHDPRLLFGLGDDRRADVEIEWPGGSRTRAHDLPAGSYWRFVAGEQRPIRLEQRAARLPDPGTAEPLALRVGEALPKGSAETLTGELVELRALVPGGARCVVNLWASWCRICPREMRFLAGLAKRHPRDSVIGISIDPPTRKAAIETRIHAADATYRNAIASKPLRRMLFGGAPPRVPITLLIEVDGTVAQIESGWNAAHARRLERFLEGAVPPGLD